MIEPTFINISRVAMVCIMFFSLGLKCDTDEYIKKLAEIVFIFSMVINWVFIIAG